MVSVLHWVATVTQLRCSLLCAAQMDDIEALNFDDLSAVAKLYGSTIYKTVMKVRWLLTMRSCAFQA